MAYMACSLKYHLCNLQIPCNSLRKCNFGTQSGPSLAGTLKRRGNLKTPQGSPQKRRAATANLQIPCNSLRRCDFGTQSEACLAGTFKRRGTLKRRNGPHLVHLTTKKLRTHRFRFAGLGKRRTARRKTPHAP